MIELQLEFLIDLRKQRFLLGNVDYLKTLREKQLMGILPQEPRAEPVIRADQPGIVFRPDKLAYAPSHLSGGFVGKGNAKNVCRIDTVLFYKIRAAADEKLRFFASRAGYHAHVSLGFFYGLKLFFIELPEKVHVRPPRYFACEIIIAHSMGQNRRT